MVQTVEPYRLSRMELEVLRLVAQGYTHEEVAAKLDRSRSLVTYYLMGLRKRTGAMNSTALVRLYAENPGRFLVQKEDPQ